MARIFLYISMLLLLLACGGAAVYSKYFSMAMRDSVASNVLGNNALHNMYYTVEYDSAGYIELFYDYTGENGDSIVWAEGMLRVPVASLEGVVDSLLSVP